MRKKTTTTLCLISLGTILSNSYASDQGGDKTDLLTKNASKYASQVFNLSSEYAQTALTKNMEFGGVGFIVNPSDQIIFTSSYICTPNYATFITHTRADGSLLETPDIEIVGTTPTDIFGTYGFLKFKEGELVTTEMIPMEMEVTPPAIKSPIAYFKYMDDTLKIEVGTITNNYAYDRAHDYTGRGMHFYDASFRDTPPSIGSPVFNTEGKLLGLVGSNVLDKKQQKLPPFGMSLMDIDNSFWDNGFV